MNAVEAALRRLVSRLEDQQLAWAVIGGLAVSARCEPRFTRDVDVCVVVDGDAAAQQVVAGLVATGYAVHAFVEQDVHDRLATVRLTEQGTALTGVVADLLFASSGIESEVVAGADQLEILPGLVVPVATAGHLVALKLLSRDDAHRPQDAGDLRALSEVLTDRDRAQAREAVDLIVERGFHRKRDLAALLTSYLG